MQLDASNALDIVAQYDVVIDGTDNFAARYCLNDASVLTKRPCVHGSILRFEGQATVFYPGRGPCYRCLYPDPPPPDIAPSCAMAGVLGVLPGPIGLIQATEAVKLILGIGQMLMGRLLVYDALTMRFKEINIKRDPRCPICGDAPTITSMRDVPVCGCTGKGVGASAQGASGTAAGDITVLELKEWMDQKRNFVLIDVREPHEFKTGKIPGSRLIPLGALQDRLGDFSKDQSFVVHCRSGGRSKKAQEILKKAGYQDVRNLSGGIKAWIEKVDPSVRAD